MFQSKYFIELFIISTHIIFNLKIFHLKHVLNFGHSNYDLYVNNKNKRRYANTNFVLIFIIDDIQLSNRRNDLTIFRIRIVIVNIFRILNVELKSESRQFKRFIPYFIH